jgi:hypothetical protein
MIIIGYQGIGKSTLAGKRNCIDLESGNFWVDGKRDEEWYIPYCQIANHLSQQGFTVFVSSHEVVREELKKSEEIVYCVFPSILLRDEWVWKLKNRYEQTGLEKDFKAWKNAEDRYKENIAELMNSNFKFYEIGSMGYSLLDIVLKLERRAGDRYFPTIKREW